MTLDSPSCQQKVNIPFEFIELTDQFEISVASQMTGITNATPSDEDAERNTVTTDNSSVLSFASPGKTKQLWNGVQVFTVQKVYLDNVVELPTKDELSTMKNTIKKVVFPKMKFIPNWEDCLILEHNKEQDVREKSAGWAYNVFKQMNWQSDDLFPPWMQAIKWNTYKYSFKQQFNSVRACIIANLKKHMMSGKSDRFLLCFNKLIQLLTTIFFMNR